jgi:hypothetical protein
VPSKRWTVEAHTNQNGAHAAREQLAASVITTINGLLLFFSIILFKQFKFLAL